MAKQKNEETSALATAGAPAPLAAVPDYVEKGNVGLEHLRARDMAWPRLRLIQKTSPEVDTREAQPGQVLNDLTKQIVVDVDSELSFVPVLHFLSWIEWAPIEEGGGLLGASMKPDSELAARSMAGELNRAGKPAVTEYHNFLCVLPDVKDLAGNPAVVLVSFFKTSYKVGRRLLMLAKMRNTPIFAGKYVLSTKMVTRGKNTWYEYEVNNAPQGGWAPKELYESAKALHAEIGPQMAQFDPAKVAGATDAAEPATTDDDGEGGPKNRGQSDKY